MRQEPRQALKTVKSRARANAFTYSQHAFELMVDSSIYEEDIKRAFSTARLVGVHYDGRTRTHYVLEGFGMDESALVLVCSLQRRLVEVVDLYWA
ncbi:MAG TPA: DUF4258 domain-containing protein [Planctomycetota bacterium]|nr:DUF4258 domain-containing protein [Planctomycetota bacterium]